MDPFDFQLAEALGQPLGVVLSMPNRDIAAWRAYFVWSAEQRKLASKNPKPERPHGR